MARPKKAKAAPAAAAPPPAVCEALLLATVCMVGLPVEVQVRDGSAYAGVFHAASLHGGYGARPSSSSSVCRGAPVGFRDHGNGVRSRDPAVGWTQWMPRGNLVALLCFFLECVCDLRVRCVAVVAGRPVLLVLIDVVVDLGRVVEIGVCCSSSLMRPCASRSPAAAGRDLGTLVR
jgi:hypothetical protein